MILRTSLPPGIVTYTAPAEFTAIPSTPPKSAKVETAPPGVTLRIQTFELSTTYRFPDESIAIPFGALNRAFVPFPSRSPGVLPANVETTPFVVILRIRLLFVSVINRFPDESITTPSGPLNCAVLNPST